MPLTILAMMNASLKRVGVIQGDAGNLVTSTVTSTATGLTATEAFTDSARQRQIDVMLQCLNEANHSIFSLGLLPKEAATGSFNLASGTREYALPSDFERMAGMTWETRCMRGATSGQLLYEYPDGYAKMLADQPIATDWVGDPQSFALSPVDSYFRLDREPATGATDLYYYLYDKRIGFSSTQATTALPYSETVADSLVPVLAEMWSRNFKKESDSFILSTALTRALEYAGKTQRLDRWAPGRG